MEERKERKFVCKYCNKQFPSGKSLGGHVRIHTNENSVDSDRYNGNMNKRLVDHQREILALKQQKQQRQQQLCCTECGKGFVSLKALCIHMACHSEKEKMLMDSQSDTETYSAPTRKRSKRVVMKQSNSESFSNGSSSFASEIDQEDKDGALNLIMMSRDSSFKKGHNLVMNSFGESSDNNSVIVETKSSSGEELKILSVKNGVLETDKVAVVDQLRSADVNGVILYDSDISDADYFMNGPKKSDSGFSVNRSPKTTEFASKLNNSFKRFKNSDETGSKYELSRTKRVPSYEVDSCAHKNNKIHRFSDIKTAMVKKAADEKKKSKGHKCPICFKVFKSGQALGGHKRSHNQEHTHIAEMRNRIDLNLPGSDSDE